MSEVSSLRWKKIFIEFRRTVHEYRTLVFALIAFCIFSLVLTDSTCVLRTITGLPCPGCGLTRATYALLRLDLAGAFHYNPMVFLVWPFSLLFTMLIVLKKTTIKKCTPFFIVFGVCMILVYIVRMILYFPNLEPMIYDDHSVLGRALFFIRQLV